MQNQFPTTENCSSPLPFDWNLESSNPGEDPATDPPDNQGGGTKSSGTTPKPPPEEEDPTTEVES